MIGANYRARRRGRANRPERDTEGWLARRLVVREPAAGRDQARTTLVDALFGATADAGSIPAASTKSRFAGILQVSLGNLLVFDGLEAVRCSTAHRSSA